MNGSAYIIIAALALTACRKDPDPLGATVDRPFVLELPPGAPTPVVPGAYPLTGASVALGKALFFDQRLSRDGTVSCASCHHPTHAFSDTMPLSLGVQGRQGLRNAPTLANVAYHPALFRDGGVPTLEAQVIAPVQEPNEMDHTLQGAADRLSDEYRYQQLSRTAYGRALDPFVITRAIAAYERTLISGWSRFDRFYYQGDALALTASESRGWQLFSGSALNCMACHSGFDLSDHSFQNVGQYLEYDDPGRARISLDPGDVGKFKVPTLRNVALTGPYMHDGAMATLSEVVDHFAHGGQAHPNKSPLMTNFTLTEQEKVDLVAFLYALTDERPIDQVP